LAHTYNLKDSLVYAYGTQTQPNPPSWGLDRIDDYEGLDSSYTCNYTGAGVEVFILDTGMVDQPEFGGRFVSCLSFTSEPCGTPITNVHGSHVAGKCIGYADGNGYTSIHMESHTTAYFRSMTCNKWFDATFYSYTCVISCACIY
jgi:hypothetical protein